jgi:formamidopyrimidine-DNA glycosylase
MPELLEVEAYRRAAAHLVGHRVSQVGAPDAWYLKRGLTAAALADVLCGARVEDVRRKGKLLLLDTDAVTVGLRFGMTGRLLVDDRDEVGALVYAPARERPEWDRLVVDFEPAARLRVQDPRRLGGVEVEPDEDRLGPDAASVGPDRLVVALATERAVKAALLDQHRVAGIGNLLADELLWRSAIDPARPGSSLDADEVARLHRGLVETLEVLGDRGGSHTGDLQDQRHREGVCPRDGTPLLRRQLGGRTTYSCPSHQR